MLVNMMLSSAMILMSTRIRWLFFVGSKKNRKWIKKPLDCNGNIYFACCYETCPMEMVGCPSDYTIKVKTDGHTDHPGLDDEGMINALHLFVPEDDE
uniref:Uncharacterized protein n=1 Tax=Meloidogyne enterolobii TaxID=390850 RepID=A0A6V7UHW1_MELEN|nr:unnamed protein product [Meloidogyne enterolobii]